MPKKKEKVVEKKKLSAEKRPHISSALKFSKILRAQFPEAVKGILLFGSVAKASKKTGDVDVLVILDDTGKIIPEQLERIDEHIRLIASQIGNLHPQIHTITDFWDWIRHGDPILFNFLRYGYPLYDTGFIKPTQQLLQAGKITPSEEAIRLYSKIGPKNLEKADAYIKAGIVKLYEAMTAAAQAVAMVTFNHQPEPKEIPSVLEKLMEQNKLEKKYVEQYREIFKIWKQIDHQELKEISGKLVEEQTKAAKEFVERMKKFLTSYLEE